jgi:hypothetical protein
MTGEEGGESVARKPRVPPGEQTMSNPTPSIGKDREIENVFDDLEPTREPGVGPSEHRIELVVEVKGEPDWIRPFRKRACHAFKGSRVLKGWGAASDDRLIRSGPALRAKPGACRKAANGTEKPVGIHVGNVVEGPVDFLQRGRSGQPDTV